MLEGQPCNEFVQKRCIKGLCSRRSARVMGAGIGRHVDAVDGRIVAGTVPALTNHGVGGGDEGICAFDAAGVGVDRLLSRPVYVPIRQSVDLVDTEDRIGLEESKANLAARMCRY